MWAALAAIVTALSGLVIPILLFWFITSHFQQIQAALKQAFTYPGIAVGATVTPLVIGGLVFFGGLTTIGLLFYFGERKIGGPRVPAPTLAPLSVSAFPAGAAVTAARYAPYPSASYTGYGFTGGAGAGGILPIRAATPSSGALVRPSAGPPRSSSSRRSSRPANRPAAVAGPRASRSASTSQRAA